MVGNGGIGMYIKKSLMTADGEINIGNSMIVTYAEDGEDGEKIEIECRLVGFETICRTKFVEVRNEEGDFVLEFGKIEKVRKMEK